jgi:two-component sensor histidine kinase
MGAAGAPVLIHAPLAGDAEAIAKAIAASVDCTRICDRPEHLSRVLSDEAACVIVAHEGASRRTGEILLDHFGREPPWSRLPVLFLVASEDRTPPACRLLKENGGKPYLKLRRPVDPMTLRRAVETQQAERRRQFETRDLLKRLEESEARQRTLLSELRHRSRNTLALMQALFRLSAREAPDREALTASFSERLSSLVRAHESLSDASGQTRNLASLIREHAAPYAQRPEQIRLEGGDVELPQRIAFEFAMIVHELATNAAKYGAFSNTDGEVEVRWTTAADGGTVDITWSERGGPPVTPPERRGLGSTLIQGMNLGAGSSGEIAFHPGGIVWRGRLGL